MLITERIGDMIHAYSTYGAIYLNDQLMQEAFIPFEQAQTSEIREANLVDMVHAQQQQIEMLTRYMNKILNGGENNAD